MAAMSKDMDQMLQTMEQIHKQISGAPASMKMP
jgi:hypothetical protein